MPKVVLTTQTNENNISLTPTHKFYIPFQIGLAFPKQTNPEVIRNIELKSNPNVKYSSNINNITISFGKSFRYPIKNTYVKTIQHKKPILSKTKHNHYIYSFLNMRLIYQIPYKNIDKLINKKYNKTYKAEKMNKYIDLICGGQLRIKNQKPIIIQNKKENLYYKINLFKNIDLENYFRYKYETNSNRFKCIEANHLYDYDKPIDIPTIDEKTVIIKELSSIKLSKSNNKMSIIKDKLSR